MPLLSRSKLSASLPVALLVLAGLYLAYILFSPGGLPRVIGLENEIHRQGEALRQAHAVTEALQQEVDRLASDPNYIAEAARTQLGLLDPLPAAQKTASARNAETAGRRPAPVAAASATTPAPSPAGAKTPEPVEAIESARPGAAEAQLDQVFEALLDESPAQPE